MDQFDRAQELDARYLQQALNEWSKSRPVSDEEPSMQCLECGGEIPAARRLAVPGCRRCITCQQTWEQHNR